MNMYIVLGATGRVGTAVVEKLLEYKLPLTTVVRDEAKADYLKELGATVAVVDYFDSDALKLVFKDANVVFLLTPENPESEDYLKDTAAILQNYHSAIKDSNIKRIVGLSSFGAQHPSGTGNLEASYMLEHAFDGLNVEKIFVRPTYYYSNWMGYYDLVKERGILPTFFPADFAIPMISPVDVGEIIAEMLAGKKTAQPVVEIAGPKSYSSNDIAAEFGKVLNRDVDAMSIPRSEWESTLIEAGFSPSGAKNLALMTDATISGKTCAEGDVQFTTTTFSDYLNQFCEGVLS